MLPRKSAGTRLHDEQTERGRGAFLLGVAALAGFSCFVYESRAWIFPATFQLVGWLASPRVNVTPPVIPALVPGLVLTLVIFATAIAVTDVTLRGPAASAISPDICWQESWQETVAYGLLLAYVAVGYIGTIAGALGWLHQWFLIPAVLLMQCIALLLIWKARSSSIVGRVSAVEPWLRTPQSPYTIALLALAGVIVGLAGFHALGFPVTEWDATIYHAETARLWFLYAPSPPVAAGPAVGNEISFNYPPLFPAIGAFYYVVLGQFSDFFLRLVSPVLFVALLLLIHGYCSRHGGALPAAMAVGLCAATPVVFNYGVWSTSYMLSTFAVTAAVMQVSELGPRVDRRRLVLIGALVGIAMATSYLALYIALFAGAALGIHVLRAWRAGQRGLTPSAVACFVIPVMVIGLPWYLRNFLVLGDPVFPLGGNLFHPVGLDTPLLREMFAASVDQIRNSALGHWKGRQGLELVAAQLRTLASDPTLLPLGAPVFVLAALRALVHQNSRLIVLVTWVILLEGAQLVIGWFWLRTLSLAMPIFAVATADALARALCAAAAAAKSGESTGPLGRRLAAALPHGSRLLISGAILVAVTWPGVLLAMVGPNQETWTTWLTEETDFFWSWEHIGDEHARLTNVFGGDARAWEWLNDQVPRTGVVASLENRT